MGIFFEVENKSDHPILITEIVQFLKRPDLEKNTKIYMCDESFLQYEYETESLNKGWRFWSSIDEKFKLLQDKEKSIFLEKKLIIKPNKNQSLILTKHQVIMNFDNDLPNKEHLDFSNSRRADQFSSGKTYYNDDREDAWAGIIKYAIMKPKYEYSYSFKKDYLKIDDKKFEK